MGQVIINRDELRNKIYGCWMGKNIGGTLGGPFEGRRELLDVRGYTTPPGEPLPNDDLDLQLIWLKAFQERGPRGISAAVLGEYWLNYISPYWNEYGINKANQRMGLIPPLSGEYQNEWKHSNGAWIRSEIWACLAPGCPDIAIRYAYEDASVDHGGGEGTNAALFIAAIQSAAFVVGDRDQLIQIGLSKIPADCRVARSINVVLRAYAEGKTWQEARSLALKDREDLGWFQAPANVAFVIIGWLYGEGDFGKSLCIAVSCGDDTDCTGATLGAILGIIMGYHMIPEAWTEPIGDRILTIAIDRGSCRVPGTLNDLTDQVIGQIGSSLATFGGQVRVADTTTDLSGVSELNLLDQTVARQIWARSPYSVVFDFVHTRVILDYGREPVIRAGEPFLLKVTLINQMPDCRHMELNWHVPAGWRVLPSQHLTIPLWAYSDMRKNETTLNIIADEVNQASYRGILEIIAQGRPTIGLIPLVFLNAA
jgi:ADP-ribosylglycohydrolase